MLLSLVCNAVFGGSGGGVACGATDPIAAPVTPCGVYVNSTTGQIFWYFNGQWNPPSGGGAALAWGNRVVANGGVMPSAGTLSAVSTFLTSIASLTSRIWHLNIIAPDSLLAMRTPLIDTFGSDPWTPVTIGAGGGSLDVNGWQSCVNPANATMYDFGVTPNLVPTFTVANGGLTVYAISPTSISATPVAGSNTNAVTAQLQIQLLNAGGTCAGWVWNNSGASPANSPPNATGIYSVNRTAANSLNLYYANSIDAWSSLASNPTNNAVAPNAVTMAAGGIHSGAAYTATFHKISFLAVHDGFSSADGQILFNAVQAFRVAIGGGFI